MGPCIPSREMLVFVEGRKPENPEKNRRGKDVYQQQTQSTYDAGPQWWEASALTKAEICLGNGVT